MGVVLLVGGDKHTLDSVGLLAELEEDDLGAWELARCLAERRGRSSLTLGTGVLEPGADDDLLADVSVGDVGKVEPLAAYFVSSLSNR